MKIFIIKFGSPLYPEDNFEFGYFLNKENAEKCIEGYIRDDKQRYPNYPRRYQQHRLYYEINEFEAIDANPNTKN